MKKTLVIIILSVLCVFAFSQTTLFVYNNFAVVNSNEFRKASQTIIIPTTNMAMTNSLALPISFSYYSYHKAEKYSLDLFLKAYLGKNVEFEFANGNVRKVKVLSISPIVLQDVQSATVYVSPAGQFMFPALAQVDSRNYFLVSTTATDISNYHYTSAGIGWKAIYTLDINNSNLQGKVELWNKTDTTFKKFHLFLVAGKAFESFRSLPTYASKAMNGGMENFTLPTVKSSQGYKIYDFGEVPILSEKNDIFLNLFNKKVEVKKINAIYDPRGNFTHALQALRINHSFPIPQGILNVYSNENGSACYLGQSNVPDSPASSTIEAVYGENFDLQVKSLKTAHLNLSKNTFRDSYLVTVKNASASKEGIWIYVHVPQSSTVESEDVKIERLSASEIRFYVEASPKSEVKVGYNVQWSY